MKKVCVFTSTRADYGLLAPVIQKIAEHPHLQLQILASGSHLRPEHGNTWQEIEDHGFAIDAKVPIMQASPLSSLDTCQIMSTALAAYAQTLHKLAPDIILVLGDRYETLCLAVAASVLGIPLAHYAGGELTLGAMDDAFRHCITKLSLLHFTATEQYRNRVIQMGEEPKRCFNVGSLGVENIKTMPLLNRDELNHSLGFELPSPYLLITFHPETMAGRQTIEQCQALLNALDKKPEYNVLITKANADQHGQLINDLLEAWAKANQTRVFLRSSLGQLRYLSAMKHAAAVVGNSSSGIIEAPSLHVPTVDIGDRQKGRIAAESVLNCPATEKDILAGLNKALSADFVSIARHCQNPYEKTGTSKIIANIINGYALPSHLEKPFFDIEF